VFISSSTGHVLIGQIVYNQHNRKQVDSYKSSLSPRAWGETVYFFAERSFAK